MSSEGFFTLMYGDAAVRMSDTIRIAIANGHVGEWMAFRLSDGGSDDVIYESKEAATKHQLHEFQCAYVRIPADNYGPRAAWTFLNLCRVLYDKGLRITDPQRNVIMPRTLTPEMLRPYLRK